MKLIKIYLIIAVLLSGCKHKTTPPEINVELYGKWTSNDNLCNLELVRNGASIMVGKFSGVNNKSLEKIDLNFKKNGIYFLFSAVDPTLKFNIVYVEGELSIDNYCSEPLHKVSN